MSDEKNFPKQKTPSILMVLIGLPASGKSTFAKQIVSYMNHNTDEKVLRIDIDQIRALLFGDKFDPANEPIVKEQKDLEIKSALKNYSVVIVDDMHYYVSMRHDYYLLAQKYNAIYFSIFFDVPDKISLEWNKLRPSVLPDFLIQDISAKFNFPGSKYSWDIPSLTLFPHETPLDNMILQTLSRIIQIRKDYDIMTKDLLHSVNSYETSDQNMNDENHDYKENIELSTRKMVNQIIINPVNNPIILDIEALLSKTYNLERNSTQFSKKLNDLRNLYKKQIFSNKIESISLQSFRDFIKFKINQLKDNYKG